MSESKQIPTDAAPGRGPSTDGLASIRERCWGRSAASRRRRLAGVGLLFVLTAVFHSHANGSRKFWTEVWERGTAFPAEFPGNSLVELAGFQPRRGPAFDFSQLTVPREEIRPGGPPRDGIPALTEPRLISADEATYLQSNDRVIGVIEGKDARAYPLKILNYHEIVNDDVGKTPIAVTYCPLCDSAAVFDRRTPLGKRDFGVSGFLYNSNVLMYDRGGKPESLWSQLMTQGVSGPAAEKSLKTLPLELTTWSDWRARNPQTTVLSPQTGHRRDYSRTPYGGYFENPRLMFPVKPLSDRLPNKERVLGIWTETGARAYPESAFSPDQSRIEDQIDGNRIVIQLNPDSRSLRVAEADEGIEWMYSLWFAWYAFRPETEVFERESQ